MSAHVLINVVLQKLPVRKISKTGKPYLMASARDGNGPDAKWWTVFAFTEAAIGALEALTVGEAFAATGIFDATVWVPEGREPRVNLTLTADAVLSAHKPKAKSEGTKRQPRAASARQAEASNTGGSALAAASWPMNDDIPFAAEWR